MLHSRDNNKLSVTFAGKCTGLDNPVTGGDRYLVELHRALRSNGVETGRVREPAFPLRGRLMLPAAVLWSLSLNGWYAAKRNDLRSSLVLEDYSSRTRLFLSNRSFRGPRYPGVVSLVQGFYHSISDNRLMKSLEERLARSYLGSLDMILANSESTAAEAARLGACRERIKVVKPGLDDRFMRMEPRPKSKLGSPVRILFVGGQCKPVKGLEYLISAIGLLGDRNVQVTLAGETSGCHFRKYIRRLKELCRKLDLEGKVEFAGLISPEKGLLKLYENADIFVLPSLWEGYGIAALEAMCYGLPVVATRAGGITEVVRDNETGFLVPPRDAESLAAALARLMDNPGLWRYMSAAAAKRAVDLRRSWTEVGEECFHHVEDLWRGYAA